MTVPGAFCEKFAARRQRRIVGADCGLLAAICQIVPSDRSILDLGAGTGEMVNALRLAGREAIGVDGTPNIEALTDGAVLWGNLASELSPTWRKSDWAICIEVGEHIPQEHQNAFLNNLANAAAFGLIVSWALPGQRGRNHVNCRSPEWVAAELGSRGWAVDELQTSTARAVAGNGWVSKLLVFQRRFPCSSST